MSDSVQSILRAKELRPGDAYLLNTPYNGGTHLPDMTVVSPVFDPNGRQLRYFVASRAHHADIGGMTPGSMPPDSRTIYEEGVLFDAVQIVAHQRDVGRLRAECHQGREQCSGPGCETQSRHLRCMRAKSANAQEQYTECEQHEVEAAAAGFLRRGLATAATTTAASGRHGDGHVIRSTRSARAAARQRVGRVVGQRRRRFTTRS